MIRKERRPIHILASYRLTVRGFVLVKAKPYFSSLPHLTCVQFLRKVFFNVFSCSKQNNENILQNSKSIVVMTHDGNWQTLIFVSSSSYLYTVSSKVFFNVFSCSKQNKENSLQNRKSIVVKTHDGNCCNDVLLVA